MVGKWILHSYIESQLVGVSVIVEVIFQATRVVNKNLGVHTYIFIQEVKSSLYSSGMSFQQVFPSSLSSSLR